MTARAVVVSAAPDVCACCGSEPERGERLVTVCRVCFEQLVNLTAQPERKPHRLLTVNQAAEILGVSPRTVRGWISDGTLPALRIVEGSNANGRRYRIRSKDLRRFLADRAMGETHDH